jgi:drug/metabolite transporter (DMT)-like permease
MPHTIAAHRAVEMPAAVSGPDPIALGAFAVTTLFAGGNAIAIRLGYAELAPFWGAAVRFISAAFILLVVVAVMRLAWPRGRALTGVLLYGVLSFGLSYMFGYWALTEVTAGTAMVVLATTPLLTLILAVVQGIERFRLQGLIGAIVAAIGIAFVFRSSIGVASPGAMLALLGGALCIAEASIVIKKFPRVHPVVENAMGMTVGGGLLLALSLVLGEPRVIPSNPWTQLSLLYLIVFGSIGMFLLYLLVLSRWTASGASYVMLIAPLVTIVLGVVILDEPVRADFLIGGVLVLAGVYVGAFASKAASISHGSR